MKEEKKKRIIPDIDLKGFLSPFGLGGISLTVKYGKKLYKVSIDDITDK